MTALILIFAVLINPVLIGILCGRFGIPGVIAGMVLGYAQCQYLLLTCLPQ